MNSTFQNLINESAISILSEGESYFLIYHCRFTDNEGTLVHIIAMNTMVREKRGIIVFKKCEFTNNRQGCDLSRLIQIYYLILGPDILIDSCSFHHNSFPVLLDKHLSTYEKFVPIIVRITVSNTDFSSNTGCFENYELVRISYAELRLIGPVVFYNISNVSSIIKLRNTNMICFNYIEFSLLQIDNILQYHEQTLVLFIQENTTLNISMSSFSQFAAIKDRIPKHEYKYYQPCYFQYLSDHILDGKYKIANYSIIFENNFEHSVTFAYNNLPIVHCSWLQQSAFNTAMPLEVNSLLLSTLMLQ